MENSTITTSDNINYSDQPQIYENPPYLQVHKTPAFGRGVDKCPYTYSLIVSFDWLHIVVYVYKKSLSKTFS